MIRRIIQLNTLNCFLRGTSPKLGLNQYLVRILSTEKNSSPPVSQSESESARKWRNPFVPSGISVDKHQGEFLDDAEKAKRLKVLQLEADILYQEGRRVPQLAFFKDEHWDHVLTLSSRSARIKFYSYLWQIEMRKLSAERKKAERAQAVIVRKEELRKQREENDHIIYGLGHNSLFLRIYDTTVNTWQNNRLTRAMQFGTKLVLDCSYDSYMTRQEARNAAKQLMLCFSENRAHDDPFDLHFCNVDLKSICMRGMQRFIPTMLDPEFPMNLHSECFTSIFPRESLVYLTPHCRTDLVEYNHDDVYIVGAMVDTVNNEPLSLAKAKKMGIRMARLPLDRYLQWGSGSGKSLTLNQVINIMLDLKFTGDWSQALKHVPRRKIVDIEEEPLLERRRLHQRAGKLNVRIDELIDFCKEKNTDSKHQPQTGKPKLNSVTASSNKR